MLLTKLVCFGDIPVIYVERRMKNVGFKQIECACILKLVDSFCF